MVTILIFCLSALNGVKMQSTNLDQEVNRLVKRTITLRIRDHASVAENTVPAETPHLVELEEWRETGSEYPGYCVSSLGRIRGLKGKILTNRPDTEGYIQVKCINSAGRGVTRFAHILIAKAFIPNLESKPVVNHINGIRNDNRVVNLGWATLSENAGLMRLNKVLPDLRRQIIQYSEDGQPIRVWHSLMDASKAIQGSHTGVVHACQNKTMYKGYQWRYYDEMVNPENEEWKSLVYDGVTIQISNFGRIRNAHNRIVGFSKEGYVAVNIKNRSVAAHRLICMAWYPIENPELFVVNHIDNNSTNNRIENLEWITQGENIDHYYKNFRVRSKTTQNRPIKQLTPDGVTVISEFASATEAFEKIGICQSNITAVCQGRRKLAGGFIWQYQT